MLLVGIDLYGFGAWAQIRDDPQLEMTDKFFLEEHRIEKKEERTKANKKDVNSPGAVHLVRRAEYLLSVLQAKHSNDAAAMKAVANHHRNNKKLALVNGHRRTDVGSAGASPAPPMVKKGSQQRDRDRDRERTHNHGEGQRSRSHGEDGGTPRPDKRKHSGPSDERIPKRGRVEDHRRSRPQDDQSSPRPDKRKHRDEDGERSHKHRRHEDRRKSDKDASHEDERRAKAIRRLDELRRMGDNPQEREKDPDVMLWFLLKPVRENFEKILSTTKEKVKSSKERAKIFGDELTVIGKFLDSQMTGSAQGLKTRFW